MNEITNTIVKDTVTTIIKAISSDSVTSIVSDILANVHPDYHTEFWVGCYRVKVDIH